MRAVWQEMGGDNFKSMKNEHILMVELQKE